MTQKARWEFAENSVSFINEGLSEPASLLILAQAVEELPSLPESSWGYINAHLKDVPFSLYIDVSDGEELIADVYVDDDYPGTLTEAVMLAATLLTEEELNG